MEALKQWAVCLIICGIGGSVISLLSPRGSMEKTLRAVIGIFVVSAVCMPLANLKKGEKILPAFLFEESAFAFSESLEEQMLGVCQNTVGVVVKETAEEMHITDYTVKVDADVDELYCIIMHDIHIVIPDKNADSAAGFAAVLQERIGVPVSVECE